MAICLWCNGSGREWTPCPLCKAKGCHFCKMAGRVQVTCTLCKGSGRK